jgi:hypothetical protein
MFCDRMSKCAMPIRLEKTAPGETGNVGSVIWSHGSGVSELVMCRRTLILFLLALVGCQSPRTTTGNFAQFFVSEIRRRGGRKVERDEFGLQIHLFGAEFNAVDSFMSQVLGEPKISVPQNLDGNAQRMYDGKISGMHIQLVRRKTEIYIVAIGPWPEEGSALPVNRVCIARF